MGIKTNTMDIVIDKRVVTPKDMSSGIEKFDEALTKFKNGFEKENKDEDYYHIVIIGEYTREVCEKVKDEYEKAGWLNVTCKTSSENGERPGLTGLQLYRK